jgi:hypothetical protein
MGGAHLEHLADEQHPLPVREQVLDGQMGKFNGAHAVFEGLTGCSAAACLIRAVKTGKKPFFSQGSATLS